MAALRGESGVGTRHRLRLYDILYNLCLVTDSYIVCPLLLYLHS